MNDNSSRFGKFIEVQFSETGVINGASIQTYLLEKSRIVHLQSGERCYHIFYQLLAGASPELRTALQISESPEDYKTLAESDCYEIDEVSDADYFQKTRHAMDIIQISPEQQQSVFEVLAAILHLGNLIFSDAGNDAAQVDSHSEGKLAIACALLGCSIEDLKASFLTRHITAGTEQYLTNLNKEKASSARDAFCMLLYSKLFDILVEKTNQNIRGEKKAKSFIGILDIYGFESFETNSFEQFCINYANEKLQQQFNHHIFKLEQQEYIKEKIDWSYIEFRDNQECLDLIEKKSLNIISILGKLSALLFFLIRFFSSISSFLLYVAHCFLSLLVDEESMFPRATEESLSMKLVKNHEKHPHFEKPRLVRYGFTVLHYAGKVTYDCKVRDLPFSSHPSHYLSFFLPLTLSFLHSKGIRRKESRFRRSCSYEDLRK
jgi:myosin heavy subunit